MWFAQKSKSEILLIVILFRFHNKMVNFLRKLNLWVILCTFLAYAAPFVSPASVSLLLFAGLAYPWLLLLNLIFIALWAISRYRYWWFSTATVLIGWTYLTGIFGIHFFKNTEGSRSPQTLRVLIVIFTPPETTLKSVSVVKRLKPSAFRPLQRRIAAIRRSSPTS